MTKHILLHFLLALTILSGCSALSTLAGDTTPPPVTTRRTPVPPPKTCAVGNISAVVYRVSQDGKDIGREVRSSRQMDGPFGPERVTLSHITRRYKTDAVELDRLIVISERVLAGNNTLLQSSFVSIDESTTWLSYVGYNGDGWERIHEELESVRDPIQSEPESIDLSEQPIIGFDLNETLRNVARETQSPQNNVLFYVARQQAPLSLDITPRTAAVLNWGGKSVPGFRVNATRAGTDRIWLSVFVSEDGRILEEIYPHLHQIRTLDTGAPTPSSASGNPFVGLYSQTYLALPETSTFNRYDIVGEQPIDPADLAFIDEPANQEMVQLDERTLSLTVTAGAPDGTTPPSKRDLETNEYIDADSPLITDALSWLKSGGKSGSLPPHRKENAAAIIAGITHVERGKNRWKNADDTAEWLMKYVHAILPEKQHTHTMKSASVSLMEGTGDCTEHSVLFAALMRAAGVPTRLVSGIYLARGGAWVYHMWNEYWDGSRWQSIDTAVGPFYRTGAHYIALGRGVSDFADHRNKIAFFLDTAFSGLAINLTSATDAGQELHLARPTRQHFSFADATIFNATTFMRRGDMTRALAVVEKNERPDTAPLNMLLMKAELLFENKRFEEALKLIETLRARTSLPSNVLFLNILEIKCLIATAQFDIASARLDRLCDGEVAKGDSCRVFRSRFLEAQRKYHEALSVLDAGLALSADSVGLRTARVSLLANPEAPFSTDQIDEAIRMGNALLLDTYYADAEALKAMTHLLFRRGDTDNAMRYLYHSLLMQNADETLMELKSTAMSGCVARETPPAP